MIDVGTNKPSGDLLEAAKFYRDRWGLIVHPLFGPEQGGEKERGKRPKWAGYTKPDYRGCDTDESLEAAFANGEPSNLGVVVRRPHVIVDLDSKPDGGESVRAWLAEHPELGNAPREKTPGGAHLHFICHDIPPDTKAKLEAKLNDKVMAEVFIGPANVVVSPSIHATGAQYEWEHFEALPEVEWKFLTEAFGIGVEAEEDKPPLPKRTWSGDETTLDIVALCKELGIYRRELGGEEPKHAIKCPWEDEHSHKDNGRGSSTIVCERTEERPRGYFKCQHGHCGGRGLRHFLVWADEQQPGVVDKCCEKLYEPEDSGLESHFRNDVGYADAFARRYSGTLRYITEEQVWLVFDEARGWHRDTSGEVTALMVAYAKEILAEALEEAKTTGDMSLAAAKINAAISLGNKRRIAPALDFAKVNQTMVISAAELDRDPYLLGVINGVVNLRDGAFYKHRPDVFVTRSCSCIYDPKAECPNFLRFFEEVQPDPEVRAFLQRLCGYTLTGVMGEHILPFHYGVGRNGKGTFLEQVLMKVMGTYAAKLTDGLVYIDKRGGKPDLEIAGLCGVRFALGEENADKGHLNERLLKSMTGADRQKGRFHYKNFIEYDPTAKIHLVGNHRPVISGRDNGIWRRFRLINWSVEIPPEREDLQLGDKLKPEFPGILNWLIAGARELGSRGTRPPASVMQATQKFREDSDVFGDFLREKTIDDDAADMPKKDLYDLYREWCEDQEIQQRFRYTKRKVGFVMIERGYHEFRATGGVHSWQGIRARRDEDGDYTPPEDRVTHNPKIPKPSDSAENTEKSGENSIIRHSAGETEETGPPAARATYRYITSRSDLAEVAADLAAAEASPLALDVETYGDNALDPRRGGIRLLAVMRKGGIPWILDLRAIGYDLGPIKAELEQREAIIHNAPFDLGFLRAKCGLRLNATDTMALSRLLNAGTNEPNGLGAVLKRHLNVEVPKELGRSDWGAMILLDDQLTYAAEDVRHLHDLAEALGNKLRAANLREVALFERELLPVVVDMSATGFAVDEATLRAARDRAKLQAAEAAQLMQTKLGLLNMASPQQLLKALRAAGEEVESTGNEVLQTLKDRELAAGIIAYRDAEKLAQQTDSLLKEVHHGRIHADFDPIGARTGRFSCKRPNLQNVPRGELRKCFAAPAGRALVVCDYSQIELRLAAVIARDERMLEAFRNGTDLHTATAAIVLEKSADAVSKADRQLAKAVNFGLIYGQSPQGLVRYAKTSYGVEMTVQRASTIRDRFFRAYAGLEQWHRRCARDAKAAQSKESRTLLGRRRLLLEGDWWQRFAGLVNTPVQGSAADGIKKALTLLHNHPQRPATANIVATIHDEIVVECDEADAKAVLSLTKRCMLQSMEHIAPGCPVEVEGGIGKSWGEAK
jgi:DNA polymerase-1